MLTGNTYASCRLFDVFHNYQVFLIDPEKNMIVSNNFQLAWKTLNLLKVSKKDQQKCPVCYNLTHNFSVIGGQTFKPPIFYIYKTYISVITDPSRFVSDSKINMRVRKNTAMHHSNFSDAVQLSSASERGVQTWSSSLPGDLLLLAAGCRATDDTATACHGSAKSPRSYWSVEGSAHIER